MSNLVSRVVFGVPLAIGALLVWFSWRTVVVINVLPGLVMAVMIVVLLGALSAATRADEINASGETRSAGDYLRDFASLLKNKALMLIVWPASASSLWMS